MKSSLEQNTRAYKKFKYKYQKLKSKIEDYKSNSRGGTKFFRWAKVGVNFAGKMPAMIMTVGGDAYSCYG